MLDLDPLRLGRLRRIRRTEYEQMVDQGWFDGEQIELLHGLLVELHPVGSRHAETVRRLTKRLVIAAADRAWISPRLPYAASDDSEPEPDLAVLPLGDHSKAHPQEALLAIEVAESSLRKDRRIKAGIYAEGGVREYWIVNLVEDVVEVHRKPGKGRFQEQLTVQRGESVAPLAFPDLLIDVDGVIPPPQ